MHSNSYTPLIAIIQVQRRENPPLYKQQNSSFYYTNFRQNFVKFFSAASPIRGSRGRSPIAFKRAQRTDTLVQSIKCKTLTKWEKRDTILWKYYNTLKGIIILWQRLIRDRINRPTRKGVTQIWQVATGRKLREPERQKRCSGTVRNPNV